MNAADRSVVITPHTNGTGLVVGFAVRLMPGNKIVRVDNNYANRDSLADVVTAWIEDGIES